MKVLFVLVICFAYEAQALGNRILVQRLANSQMRSKVDSATVTRVSAAISKAISFANDTDLDKLPAARRELPEYMRDTKGLIYDILTYPLHTAVAGGDYGEVTRLLAEGEASVNDFDQRGRAPIHIAVEVGDIHMVALLIRKGADVDIMVEEKGWLYRIVDHDLDKLKNYHDNLSAIYPVEGGNVTKVKIKDEFYNSPDKDMFLTPTYLATDGGHRDILALLLLKGASSEPVVKNRKDEHFRYSIVRSPARIAAENGDLASIVLLDAAGYDMEAETDLGWQTPFHSAVSNSRKDVVVYLLDRMPEEKVINNLYSVQNTAMAELILQKITRVPLHKRDLAVDLLYKFVHSGKVELVKLLIDKHGLNPNTKDRHGEHVLTYALYRPSYYDRNLDYEERQKEVMKALLERGADPHALSGPRSRADGEKTLFDLAREKGLGYLLVPYRKEGTTIPADEAQDVARQKALATYTQ